VRDAPFRITDARDRRNLPATSEEPLLERLRESVPIVCSGSPGKRLAAVCVLICALRDSSSSMTAVPKPMKHLIPFIPELQCAVSTFPEPDFRVALADLLSLLTIATCQTSYDMLVYRLASPIAPDDHMGLARWGHEYIRLLTLVVIRAYHHPLDAPPRHGSVPDHRADRELLHGP
jgi:26S proteasome regulatory subunit N1